MCDFNLVFSESKIPYWAGRNQETDTRPNAVGVYAKKNRYLDAVNLFEICDWKSRRKANSALNNTDQSVMEITRFSFSTIDEYAKIASLTLLHGVMWPTASVILHFCVSDRYPILDVRALESLGVKKPSYYKFEFWDKYVAKCQEIADRNNVSLRCLDKALWQYSKESKTGYSLARGG